MALPSVVPARTTDWLRFQHAHAQSAGLLPSCKPALRCMCSQQSSINLHALLELAFTLSMLLSRAQGCSPFTHREPGEPCTLFTDNRSLANVTKSLT
jgi:hypothetical protein